MALTRGIKNAFILVSRGNWREFLIRLRIALGQVDLNHDSTETVTERTHYYADSGGLAFDKIMSHFSITTEDAIVDFGCGKGGILISLSKYPFAKIAGVEIDPDLARIARKNLERLNIENVAITCCDASQFTALGDFNYFYFFDPFPCVVMKEVMKNIEASLLVRPRKVTIIYLNPLCDDLIGASGTFLKIRELPHFEHKCYVYSNKSGPPMAA